MAGGQTPGRTENLTESPIRRPHTFPFVTVLCTLQRWCATPCSRCKAVFVHANLSRVLSAAGEPLKLPRSFRRGVLLAPLHCGFEGGRVCLGDADW